MLGLSRGFDLFKVTWKMQPVAGGGGHWPFGGALMWCGWGRLEKRGPSMEVQRCDVCVTVRAAPLEGLSIFASSGGREVLSHFLGAGCRNDRFILFYFFRPHGFWELSSPTRDGIRALAVKAASPNHRMDHQGIPRNDLLTSLEGGPIRRRGMGPGGEGWLQTIPLTPHFSADSS